MHQSRSKRILPLKFHFIMVVDVPRFFEGESFRLARSCMTTIEARLFGFGYALNRSIRRFGASVSSVHRASAIEAFAASVYMNVSCAGQAQMLEPGKEG
jgi:hypothetical protein